MSPSPDWLEDMLPLARTKPARPPGGAGGGGREVMDEVLHPGEVGVPPRFWLHLWAMPKVFVIHTA